MFFQVDYLKGRFAWGHRLGGRACTRGSSNFHVEKPVKTGK